MCRIPPLLSAKVFAYYDYVMNRQIHPKDEEILAGLSGSLRQQVKCFFELVLMLPLLENAGIWCRSGQECYVSCRHLVCVKTSVFCTGCVDTACVTGGQATILQEQV